tara:strand:+ start:454 stop:1056 length:603 start_codon:yes stop_codon:yes gene_type:complete
MQCDMWFPTPIWSVNLDIDNSSVYSYCKKEKINDTGRQVSNDGGWQSNNIDEVTSVPELSELVNQIFFYSSAALDCYNYDSTNKMLKIINMWININDDKHSYNKQHNHSGSTMSGVYYVKGNENSGKICFPRPSLEDYIIQTTGRVTETNQFTYSEAGYAPEEGKLLLFPSYVPHYVETNQTNDERISIAFNIGFYDNEN